jgi:aminopeptidase N
VVETTYSGTPPTAGDNPFGDAGMSNASSPSWGNQITWTLSQPFSAYEWWPCKQSLRDKLDSVEVHLTVPANCKAGSNGVLQNVVENLPSSLIRFEWKHRHPIDYYLVSAAVGKYVDYQIYAHPPGQDSILIQNYVYDNPQTLINFQDEINETAAFIELFSSLFGPYPFRNEKYGHCMAPFSGGMEHQTMTTQGTFNATLTAHELAHQWFGDHVTCGSWADIWVNEGFATYSEFLMLQNLYPAQAAAEMNSNHTASMQQTGGAIWVSDSLNSTRIFSSRLSYSKGAAFIHTLRYLINNDSLFFAGLRLYLNRFAGRTALGLDLKAALEEVSGVNLDDAFEQWYFGEGYPSYSLRWNTGNGDLFLRLSQNASSPAITPLFTTPVEIRFTRTGLSDTIIRIPVNSANELQLISGMGNVSGSPTVDPGNFLINKTTLVQKDPTLVITGKHEIAQPKKPAFIPAGNEGVFRFESAEQGTWHYHLLDVRGRLLQSGKLQNDERLNLSGQPAGQYLIRMEGEKNNRLLYRVLHR